MCLCLFSFIASHQTEFVQNRYIGESRRSVPGILDISHKSNRDGYLVTVDIKKVFDFLGHGSLLIDFAGRFGFGNNFIDWTKVSLTN